MQFLMNRLHASAISWSSFSAWRNSRGLPTETARVKRCTIGQILSDGPIRMIQSDHPAGKRMRRRRGGANRLINCRRDPPRQRSSLREFLCRICYLCWNLTWLGKWQAKYSKLCQWVENNIEETFSFYRLPKEHHK